MSFTYFNELWGPYPLIKPTCQMPVD
ncbi:uncharacterized protein METZ01_LOCUS509566, partial [marine metagenome]